MKASEFEAKFEAGEDLTPNLDLFRARRPNRVLSNPFCNRGEVAERWQGHVGISRKELFGAADEKSRARTATGTYPQRPSPCS